MAKAPAGSFWGGPSPWLHTLPALQGTRHTVVSLLPCKGSSLTLMTAFKLYSAPGSSITSAVNTPANGSGAPGSPQQGCFSCNDKGFLDTLPPVGKSLIKLQS